MRTSTTLISSLKSMVCSNSDSIKNMSWVGCREFHLPKKISAMTSQIINRRHTWPVNCRPTIHLIMARWCAISPATPSGSLLARSTLLMRSFPIITPAMARISAAHEKARVGVDGSYNETGNFYRNRHAFGGESKHREQVQAVCWTTRVRCV